MGRTKICTKCGNELPATKKFFHKQKEGKFGVRSHCKEYITSEKRLVYNLKVKVLTIDLEKQSITIKTE